MCASLVQNERQLLCSVLSFRSVDPCLPLCRSKVRAVAAFIGAGLVAVLCVLALVQNDDKEVSREALSIRQMLVGASADQSNGGVGEGATVESCPLISIF